MNEQLTQRWIEIQFLIFVRELFNQQPDDSLDLKLFENLQYLSDYDTVVVKALAANCMSNWEQYWNKRDAIILMWAAGVPIQKLMALANTAHRTAVKWVRQYRDNPYPIKLTFTEEQRAHATKFFEAYQKVLNLKECALWLSK